MGFGVAPTFRMVQINRSEIALRSHRILATQFVRGSVATRWATPLCLLLLALLALFQSLLCAHLIAHNQNQILTMFALYNFPTISAGTPGGFRPYRELLTTVEIPLHRNSVMWQILVRFGFSWIFRQHGYSGPSCWSM